MEIEKIYKQSYRWAVLALLCLIAVARGYSGFMFSPMAAWVIPELGCTPQQFITLCMTGMLTAVFVSIPSGTLADKFGVKNVVLASLVISAVAVYLRVFARSFGSMFVLAFFGNVVNAVSVGAGIKMLSSWFGPKLSVASGIYLGAAAIGQALGYAVPAALSGTRANYLAAGTVLVIVTVLWAVFAKNAPEGAPAAEKSASVFKGIGRAAKNKYVWVIGVCVMLTYGALSTYANQLPSALAADKETTAVIAGIVTSIISYATAAGNLLGPSTVGRVLKTPKSMLLFMPLLTGVVLIASWMAGGIMMCVLLAVYGFCLGCLQPQFPSVVPVLPGMDNDCTASAMGLVSTLQLAGAFFIPSYILAPLFGTNYTPMFVATGCLFLLLALVTRLIPFATMEADAADGKSA